MDKSDDSLSRIAAKIEAHRHADPVKSYVATLFAKGDDAIIKKIGEEATEAVMAAKDGDKIRITSEVADLWFHCLVLLARYGLGPQDVLAELERREGMSGLEEKAARRNIRPDTLTLGTDLPVADTMDDCIFCKIARSEIPSKKVYEDEEILAFHDINPQSPVHFMLIPKKHIASLADATSEDAGVLGRMLAISGRLAREQGSRDGYRTIINTGRIGRQDVMHLHMHVLGGPEPLGRMLPRN